MSGLLIGLCALFGFLIGSFLNVVIYRVPRHRSIVSPRSACPSCGVAIAGRDNIPIASWLILRGECRNCHTSIPKRYLFVELTGGALFAGTAARIGFNWDLPAFLVLFSGLLALAWIDFEHLVLPKRVVYPTLAMVGALLVIAAFATGRWYSLLIATICATAWFILFYLINLFQPQALGFGDVRLAPLLGLGLGWLGIPYVLLGFFSSNLLGAVIGITLIATKRMSRHQQIPYGVFLALGTALAIFAGPELLAPLQRYL